MGIDPRPRLKYRIPMDEKPNIRRYAIVPARAVQDDTLNYASIRLLLALCIHANKAGVCWPTRQTLGRHISRSQSAVYRSLQRLIEAGYVRRLEFRNTGFKRKSRWMTRRYQVLYDGPESPLPTDEELWAPRPRLRDEPGVHKMGESEGGISSDTRACAGAFCAGIERASGVRRLIEPQFSEAARLVAAGIEPRRVLDAAFEAARAALAAGKSPPLALHQLGLHDPDGRLDDSSKSEDEQVPGTK